MSENHNKHISFNDSHKICFRQHALTEYLSWAHYQNSEERLFYINDKQHTLSMYLSGGYETHRTDIQADFGGPGRFSLMPKDSESRWQLGIPQQFMHLYFDDNYLKQLALKVFDMDPRTIEVPELTFFENPGLESLFRYQIANIGWHSQSHLALEQITNTVLVSMLQSSGLTKSLNRVKGGLAPHIARLISDYMHQHFHRQIYLCELADLAQLSEYHFCRMFKESFARTPQEYLTYIRIEQVKHRLKTSAQSLSDIALDCGFANQSHMGRYFKKQFGITPRAFQKSQL
ncbi:AraC family transcriptional regulator [Shewanella woodyi]|uniref:Transcriptional regulator, AraC family n=1 Tax=Shewanella woodyi (strain ATCC 51908 / MS32) TaxID=392500 RepID=B1KRH0_SHEWM|nr:AraC family transcriptional regulator [Shewanella woodyi]ACA86377.1 transcriptional regulator, AraC family [Shewanella woodyi ATCC 51908]